MKAQHERDERPLLAVRGLKTWLRTARGVVRAVDGVDLDLYAGQTLGLVGESGSGKSVLARSLMGLNPRGLEIRAAGQIHYAGEDLRQLPERRLRQLRGRDLAMIFQDPMTSLNPVMTIGRQLLQVLQLRLGLGRTAARSAMLELLDQVGIPSPRERSVQYPHELSGGMRQRVMIALAVACRPRVLIADEPTTALDVTVQAQILELLMQLREELHMALLLITHDLAVVSEVADRVAVMYAGQVVESGAAADVLNTPRMPYTHGLIACVPHLGTSLDEPLVTIPGAPPDLVEPPAGCRFRPRCPRAREDCLQPVPDFQEADRAHRFVCRHPLDLRLESAAR